tara:strand:+ start:207 stop:338 length:132 start_codon:yes stop_codon:yes gene_type:complete
MLDGRTTMSLKKKPSEDGNGDALSEAEAQAAADEEAMAAMSGG